MSGSFFVNSSFSSIKYTTQQPESENRSKGGGKHVEPGNQYEYFECTFCESLWKFGYPTFLALGLMGNALCLLVFSSEQKLRQATRVLCALSALLDSLALGLAFAHRWPQAVFMSSPMSTALCHVFTIANYWLPELAGWSLVYLSLERFLSGKFKSSINSVVIPVFIFISVHINNKLFL